MNLFMVIFGLLSCGIGAVFITGSFTEAYLFNMIALLAIGFVMLVGGIVTVLSTQRGAFS